LLPVTEESFCSPRILGGSQALSVQLLLLARGRGRVSSCCLLLVPDELVTLLLLLLLLLLQPRESGRSRLTLLGR
jgi:hypothetical protein